MWALWFPEVYVVEYRRFGKTELEMPVISCGGMRYQASWKSDDPVPDESQRTVAACIRRAMELGINHIETARGYGTSEYQLGKVLPQFPREEIIVQTKIGPAEDPDKFAKAFEKSFRLLNLSYIDLLSFHGVNLDAHIQLIERCLPKVEEWKREGRIRHVGFSTHGATNTILKAVETGWFEYMNVHWYWIFQDNWPAIEAATRRDMGVFIISPNDKGGKLYEPSDKLRRLTEPLHPMVFNGLFCLSRPEVHTISCGAARPGDFDVHMETVNLLDRAGEFLPPILERLEREAERVLGTTWWARWDEGLPEYDETPGEINVPWILRLRNLALAFDMVEYGKMRYNMLGKASHWFPGNTASDVLEHDLTDVLSASPMRDQIPAALEEAHAVLSGKKVSRLQQD